MAQAKMPGSITLACDGVYRVRVSKGFRSDGKRRTVNRTVHGTREDAERECIRIAYEMGRSSAMGESLTLSQYYYAIFREGESNRGKPRSAATLRGYDSQMERSVLPKIGDRPISAITHDEVRSVVRSASAPRKCKETLRTVLRCAYDDGFIDEPPMQRRIVTARERRPQEVPWDPMEAAGALAAFRDSGQPMLEAYLILGLSGLRTEEALAVSPADVARQETLDFETGETVATLTVAIRNTYTYDDGFREGTKTDFSARMMPVIVAGRDRLMQIIAQSRPERREEIPSWVSGRIVDLTYNQLLNRWRRALPKLGLRYIPPDMLRHTSETMMQASMLPDTLVSRLHGHTDLRTDYAHYMRPGLAQAEMAAREVHKIMPVEG